MALFDFSSSIRNYVFLDGFKNKSIYSKKDTISIAFFHFIGAGNTIEKYKIEFTSVSAAKCVEIAYKISKRYNDKDLKRRFVPQDDLSAY